MTPRKTGVFFFALAAIFLFNIWGLDGKSLWVDEMATMIVIRHAALSQVLAAVAAGEGRPPLFYILLRGWIEFAGAGDFSLRYFSLVLTILSSAFVYILLRRVAGRHAALAGMLLFGFSPLTLLYSRMIRAYYLGVFCASGAGYFALRLFNGDNSKKAWLGYAIFAISALYTDYVAASILIAINIAYLAGWRLRKPSFVKWMTLQALCALTFLGWLPVLLSQTGRYIADSNFADLTQGPIGFLVKLAQPILVFNTGETLLPWNPLAIGVFPLMLLLAFLGARRLVFNNSSVSQSSRVLFLLGALIPILFTVFIITGFIIRYMTFAWIGARSLAALPFYLGLVGIGLLSLKNKFLRIASAAIITAAFAGSTLNYFADREMHNPIYELPAKEIVADVERETQPGDAIVFAPDSVYGYYENPSDPRPALRTDDFGNALSAIQRQKYPRVWLVNVARDRGNTGELTPLEQHLISACHLQYEKGYAEVETSYNAFKQALTHRPGYAYKAWVKLYECLP